MTGRDAAVAKGVAPSARLFPLDHPWFVAKALDRVQPGIVLLFETELWPNFLYALHRRRTPVVIVNGRISDRTIERYRRIRALLGPALGRVERILAQSELDRERFVEIGAGADRVVVNGCTKFDQPLSQNEITACEKLRHEINLPAGTPLLTAGSVRPGEEESVIAAFSAVRNQAPTLRMIIAPRHRDRFDPVFDLIVRSGLKAARRSEPVRGEWDILLLDTIGELKTAYGIASIAFIGGTLAPIGGHNPMEPAPFGVPVIVGPHTGNIRSALSLLRVHGALIEVQDGEELRAAVAHLTADESKRRELGERIHAAWSSQLGSTGRAVAEILRIFER
jgi:3-deoxy-D-manno-octulosonic-acid transferase